MLLALAAAPAAAATLTVEGVVSPAWVERGGLRLPLAVGMTLRDKDRIRTGPGSRALLRMAEGSAVKLGENAALTVDDLHEQPGLRMRRLVRASLDVARGAFRFTTDVFIRRPAERDVKIRITTITAGIRGTDVWGKSEGERDIVCLVEGRIAVSHPQTGEFTMAEPLSFFIAPRKAKPLPVAPVDRRQLEQWANETEMKPGSGGARRGGRFRVEAASAPDQRGALATYDRLREAGYPAVIAPVAKEGAVEYRVRIVGLASERDARAVAEQLKALGVTEAAVGTQDPPRESGTSNSRR